MAQATEKTNATEILKELIGSLKRGAYEKAPRLMSNLGSSIDILCDDTKQRFELRVTEIPYEEES